MKVVTVEQGQVRCEEDGCEWSFDFQTNNSGKLKHKNNVREVVTSHLMMCHGYSRDDGWRVAKAIS